MSVDELPHTAWLVALLALPGMGPSRLTALLDERTPQAAWHALVSGERLRIEGVSADRLGEWRVKARKVAVDERWAQLDEAGMWVRQRGSSGYPERLANDIEPPHVLFGLGAELGSRSTVGIVGTRNCTSYGKRCAFEFGAALAEAGVSVVSGLALGIDAAAHQGALSVGTEHRAPPIGVVGSGLDIVYPKRNTSLWNKVAEAGSLVSETAPGVGPQKWRFPARNRIIAALSDAVVVIESHESGGSLSTVDAAQERDIEVGAVPGPITANSSVGTNRLIAEGATPVLSVDDIFAMIGHQRPVAVNSAEGDSGRQSALLDVIGWNPVTFEELCNRVTLPPSAIAAQIEGMVADGLCAKDGPWIERVR